MTNQLPISSLGYVRIGMNEPQEWADFGEAILGLQASRATDGRVQLRMDSAPARFIVEPATRPGFIAAGWACEHDDFDRLVGQLERAGIALTEGTMEACEQRSVQGFVSGFDPSGNCFELYHGRSQAADTAFESPIEGVRFIADELGLGHVVLPAPEHTATSDFYQSMLGFAMSDALTLPPPVEGAPEMIVYFLHARSPRHHSLGLFNAPVPSGIVHLMVEMTSLDAVGCCLDRVNAAGYPLTATLGRHLNDGMVSFYFLAPGGIPIEVGYDGKQFDWSDFEPTVSTVGDIWGHEYQFADE